MKKTTLIKNAFILTVTSFILRTFGIVVRSYMSNKIGAEGMGLYQLIISIYVLATTFVTAGISTAVIRLVTDALAKNESLAKIKRIMMKSMIISFFISFLAMVMFFFLAEPISLFWLKDERCILSIKILVSVLPFVSISSCIKGYFLAKRKVIMNSFSQLFEQVIRIICIFISLEVFIDANLEKICMYVILSDIISEILACIFVYLRYRRDILNVKTIKTASFRLGEFLQIAFPIAINKNMTSILRTIENILIPNKLAVYNLSRELSLSQFGYLKGMALPLIFFPASFLTALSSLLVPETSEASTLKQKNKIIKMVEKTFQFTLACAIIIASIFFLYANEIGRIFYNIDEIGFYIKWLAPLIPFMYMESAIVGIMQGLNQQKKSLKYNIIDSSIRITLICIFLPISGIKGFLAIMYISNIITSCLNAYRLLKVSNTKFNINLWLVKPIFSAASACIFCNFLCDFVMIQNTIIDVIFKVGIICSVYIVMLFLFGIVDRNSIQNILKRQRKVV